MADHLVVEPKKHFLIMLVFITVLRFCAEVLIRNNFLTFISEFVSCCKFQNLIPCSAKNLFFFPHDLRDLLASARFCRLEIYWGCLHSLGALSANDFIKVFSTKVILTRISALSDSWLKSYVTFYFDYKL